ncbi:cytidylyltransferase domain-containing protein [Chloroflexota bacterium]
MANDANIIKVGAFIQVRMKSTRLARKAMIEIEGKTIIEHLIERVKKARMPSEIVVCTSWHPDDAILIEVAKKAGVKWFAGSEDNVMERFLGAAKQEGVDIILRVTGDCPLIDPEYIDRVIAHIIAKNVDYVTVVGLPLGTGCEVFTTKALEKAHSYAIDPNYSEYLSLYFWNNPDVFHMEKIECEESVKRPDYRLTVDEIADVELMNEIYQRLYQDERIFPMEDVIELLDSTPNLVELVNRIKVKWRDDKKLVDLLNQKTRLRYQ